MTATSLRRGLQTGWPCMLLLLGACDKWTSTALRNDLDVPARLQLYYHGNYDAPFLASYATAAGVNEQRWMLDSPEGPVPMCDQAVTMESPEERVLDAQTVARAIAADACVDGTLDSGAYGLHWTLAPGEELFMARSLGPVSGHYLDSLVVEHGGRTIKLRSAQEILDRISKGRGGDHLIRLSSF